MPKILRSNSTREKSSFKMTMLFALLLLKALVITPQDAPGAEAWLSEASATPLRMPLLSQEVSSSAITTKNKK